MAIFTPHDIAEQLGVTQGKVYRLIAIGDLNAIDVSAKADKRPNWRILPSDFEDFVRSRSSRGTAVLAGEGSDMAGAPPGVV